jgi:FMN reductase
VKPPVNATLVVGNPRPGSRTMGVATVAAKALAGALRERGVDLAEADVVDLSTLAPSLLTRLREDSSPAADAWLRSAYAQVCRPGLLIVATPTFKGAYSGLLKLFADLIPREGVGPGVVAVPLTTAGWERHRSGPEAVVRALMLELGAMVPVPGLTVLESEFADLETVLAPWLTRTVPVVAAVLAATAPAPIRSRD